MSVVHECRSAADLLTGNIYDPSRSLSEEAGWSPEKRLTVARTLIDLEGRLSNGTKPKALLPNLWIIQRGSDPATWQFSFRSKRGGALTPDGRRKPLIVGVPVKLFDDPVKFVAVFDYISAHGDTPPEMDALVPGRTKRLKQRRGAASDLAKTGELAQQDEYDPPHARLPAPLRQRAKDVQPETLLDLYLRTRIWARSFRGESQKPITNGSLAELDSAAEALFKRFPKLCHLKADAEALQRHADGRLAPSGATTATWEHVANLIRQGTIPGHPTGTVFTAMDAGYVRRVCKALALMQRYAASKFAWTDNRGQRHIGGLSFLHWQILKPGRNDTPGHRIGSVLVSPYQNQYWGGDEIQRLLDGMPNLAWRVAVQLGRFCLMRIGDVCRAEWNWIDFDRRTITWVAAKNRQQAGPMPLWKSILEDLRALRELRLHDRYILVRPRHMRAPKAWTAAMVREAADHVIALKGPSALNQTTLREAMIELFDVRAAVKSLWTALHRPMPEIWEPYCLEGLEADSPTLKARRGADRLTQRSLAQTASGDFATYRNRALGFASKAKVERRGQHSFHGLRVTGACELAALGFSDRAIQILLADTTLEMTQRYTAQVRREQLLRSEIRQAVERMRADRSVSEYYDLMADYAGERVSGSGSEARAEGPARLSTGATVGAIEKNTDNLEWGHQRHGRG